MIASKKEIYMTKIFFILETFHRVLNTDYSDYRVYHISGPSVLKYSKYSVSCDLSAISVGTGTSRHRHRSIAIGTDRH